MLSSDEIMPQKNFIDFLKSFQLNLTDYKIKNLIKIFDPNNT